MSDNLPTTVSQNVSIYNKEGANHLFSLAQKFSESSLVPDHFKGKPNDVFLALQIAQSQHRDPFAVLQNLYMVHGKPGWSAQYLIGLANQSGKFRTPIMFRTKGSGDTLAVTAYAVHDASGEEVSQTISMKMAKAEGWSSRNKKYQTMPEQMLSYRAATFLVRLYAPEVTLGIQTRDEIIDITQDVIIHDANPKNDALERAREAGVYDASMELMTAKQIDDEILFREDAIAAEKEDRTDALSASQPQDVPKVGSDDSNASEGASGASEGTQGDLL